MRSKGALAEVDKAVNALPTLCFERARDHAEALMQKPVGERGPLMGLPIPIKDLNDVKGVRSTQGSPIFADNIAKKSDILVETLESRRRHRLCDVEHAGIRRRRQYLQRGLRAHAQSVESVALGGRVIGRCRGGARHRHGLGGAWFRHGRLAAQPGKLLRRHRLAAFAGASGGQRPWQDRWYARRRRANGAQCRGLGAAVRCDGRAPIRAIPCRCRGRTSPIWPRPARANEPKRVAFSRDLGITPVDPEVAEIVERAAYKLESAGVIVEEAHPDLSEAHECFQVLRALSYATGLKPLYDSHRDKLKADVVWNIEKGLALTAAEIARAEMQRGAMFRRMREFFGHYDLILCPATIVPPFPVEQRYVSECDGHKFSTYIDWLAIVYAFTNVASPAISIPAGFTRENCRSASRSPLPAARKRACLPARSSWKTCSTSAGSRQSIRGRGNRMKSVTAMKRQKILLSATLVMLAFADRPAAAFDCTKAQSPVEKAICADTKLKAADDAMAAAYLALRNALTAPDRKALGASQSKWVKSREDNCGYQEGAELNTCILSRTEERRRLLAAEPESGPGTGSRLMPVFIQQDGDPHRYDVDYTLIKFVNPASRGETLFNAEVAKLIKDAPLAREQEAAPDGMNYMAYLTVALTYGSAKILSAQMDGWTFTGGAHGNGGMSGLTIDLVRGVEMKAGDLFDAKAIRVAQGRLREADPGPEEREARRREFRSGE